MILTQIYDSGTNFKISNFNSSYMKKINNFVIGRNDFRSQSDVIMKKSASSYGLLPRHGAGLVFAIIFWWLQANITDAAEPYAAGPSAAGTEVQADGTVREILSSAALENTVTGILAVSASGDTILAYNCNKNMVPASNLKLVTTGAALHFLGSGYRFRTELACRGDIRDGVLHGDLIIKGGGDPTLAADDAIALPAETVFRQWKGFVGKAGISRIEGRIIGDSRYFDNIAEEETWLWNDIGTYYGTGTSGLSFYENKKDFLVEPGENEGDPVNVIPGFPETPWMTLSFPCTTGAAGTGNKLYYYTTAFAPYGEMRGTFAADRGRHTEEVSNKFPAYTCAWHFAEYLKSYGIICSEGPADTGERTGAWATEGNGDPIPDKGSNPASLGETFSPELKRIVSVTNRESNNFYAETIFKTLGKEYCGKGSYAGGRAAVKGILSEMGVPSGKVKIQDGSGLSRQNYVSPSFLCNFLLAMLDSPASEDFIKSLPSPGESGTLSYVMKKYPSSLKARIRMKSGSMDGTLCYSGYILPESSDSCMGKSPDTDRSGVIVFSIMTNNSTSSAYRVRLALEKAIAYIASRDAGCRQATASRKGSGTGR